VKWDDFRRKGTGDDAQMIWCDHYPKLGWEWESQRTKQKNTRKKHTDSQYQDAD
jgi:hypothetical protein